MSDASLWWLAAGLLVIAELMSGTFYLLMVALGLTAGALAAHAGLGGNGQAITAALVGAAAIVAWHLIRRRAKALPRASANPDVNLDVGETVLVEHWDADGSAHVKYRGAMWAAQRAKPPKALNDTEPGLHRIVEVQGNRLILAPVARKTD